LTTFLCYSIFLPGAHSRRPARLAVAAAAAAAADAVLRSLRSGSQRPWVRREFSWRSSDTRA